MSAWGPLAFILGGAFLLSLVIAPEWAWFVVCVPAIGYVLIKSDVL